jgi:hypothetical protein
MEKFERGLVIVMTLYGALMIFDHFKGKETPQRGGRTSL